MGGGGAPSIPQQSLGNELGDILHYLPQFTKSQFDLSSEYGPKFAQQDINQSKLNAPQYAQLGLDLTKQFGPQYAQQGFNIANELSPQYLGLNLANMQQAIAGSPLLNSMNQQAAGGLARGGSTPYLQNLSNVSQAGLKNAYTNLAGGGVDSLLGNLTSQAQTQLAQGGHLTNQEAYQQTQGTLGGFAGRNNVFNQAEAQSFLDRDALVRKRMQEAQQFAGNVEGQRQGALGLAQSQLGQAQQFGLGTQGARQGALNQAQQFGLSTQAMDQSALQSLGGAVTPPNYAGYAQAPNLAAYGAPGSSYAAMQAGLGTTQPGTQSLLNFGQNLFDANQNAAATQNIAASNKSGGLTGAGIGAAGAIGGGLLAAL
jgi:hypothetical protein